MVVGVVSVLSVLDWDVVPLCYPVLIVLGRINTLCVCFSLLSTHVVLPGKYVNVTYLCCYLFFRILLSVAFFSLYTYVFAVLVLMRT